MTEGARSELPAMLLRPALLIAGLVAAGWALRDLPMHDFAARAGSLGLLWFVVLGAVACAIGLPRQAVIFAAGYAHGVWFGAALALAAQLIGCVADLAWARLVARDWVRRRVASQGGRLARLDHALRSDTFAVTLSLRLLPVGNNLLLNLFAGALGLRLLPFLAASALGYVPQTAIFVLLGSGTSVARWTELALGGVMFGCSVALGWTLLRRSSRALRS